MQATWKSRGSGRRFEQAQLVSSAPHGLRWSTTHSRETSTTSECGLNRLSES